MSLRSGSATVLVMAGSLALAVLPGSSGCSSLGLAPRAAAPSVPLAAAPQVPGAEGTVGTGVDANGNTRVTVAVRHLAPPDRLRQGASVYVVWARPTGADAAQQQPQNLGALRVDSDLRGTLETITPMRDFEIVITAEDSPTTITPSQAQVLRAEILATGR
jgi:hypothetical protein